MYIKKIEESIQTGKIANAHYEGQDKTYSCKYINKLSDYSTEEQVVGTWINGKPIYRKVFAGSLPSSSYQEFMRINNLGHKVNLYGQITTSDGTNLPIPFIDLVSNKYFDYYEKNGIFYNHSSSDYFGLSFEITVEYTKTTD